MSTENESDSKKLKTEDQNILNSFQYNRLLSQYSDKKLVFIHGLKKENDETTKDAVIIMEKPHFTENEIKAIVEENFSTDLTLSNDIYQKMCIFPTKPYNGKRS